MHVIRRSIELDAGHRVPYHNSKCRHLHGHRYKVVASVSSPRLVPDTAQESDSGMVMDFGAIKRVMMERIHDVFDHRLILWGQDPLLAGTPGFSGGLHNFLANMGMADSVVTIPVIPTAERLAEYWADQIRGPLEGELNSHNVGQAKLTCLQVWETPNCDATYWCP